jgi:rhamnose utilization protein RhaD (predicted bifunctional aldolase and dehydrogenase)
MMQDLEQLKTISARLGRNLMMIQAAGGNTSVKVGGELWIKASGKWLRDADSEDIFVPIDRSRVLRAIAAPAPEDPAALTPVNGSPLRGSIETYFHALFEDRIVLHVHSVNAIAHATRTGAEQRLPEALQGVDWRWVPYARPGLDLTRAIASVYHPQVHVWVLANHGLIVTGDNFEEVDSLLTRVDLLLSLPARSHALPDFSRLSGLCGPRWKLPRYEVGHQPALHSDLMELAARGTIYPDNAVFLGPACAVLRGGQSLDDAMAGFRQKWGMDPKIVLVQGSGTIVTSALDAAGEEMVACFGLVLERLEDPSAVTLLDTSEVYGLLNWSAEQYRQQAAKRVPVC